MFGWRVEDHPKTGAAFIYKGDELLTIMNADTDRE